VIANGANGGKTSFSTQRSENLDGINHVVSFAYTVKDSPYLILGFEDLLGGGDRDFNDVLFAVVIALAAIDPREVQFAAWLKDTCLAKDSLRLKWVLDEKWKMTILWSNHVDEHNSSDRGEGPFFRDP
jgi:hypothetical protein